MSNPLEPSLPRAAASDGAITPEVLQRWQNELQAFFSATRSRLRDLQSVSAATGASQLRPDSPSSPRDVQGHAASALPASDAPPDRLQELKRRLAAQLAGE